MLGDLGADVVKIEPIGGDALRQVGVAEDGTAIAWSLANRNKRSVQLDLGVPTGLDTLRALTEKADVVVTNQPARLLQRWRCTYAHIAARNPRAIVISLTAFGANGPLADHGGNGTIAEAFSGFAHMNGSADGPPTLPSLALGDSLAAISGLNAVLAALYWRDANNGRGQFIDASIYEPLLGVLSSSIAAWDHTEPAPMRNGSRIANAAPRNVYRTRDNQWIAVSGPTDAQVARVLDLIGVDDQGFRQQCARAKDRVGATADELDQRVANWIVTHTVSEVSAALDASGIPNAPVNDFNALLAHPHVVDRESMVTLPGSAQRSMPRAFAPMSETPTTVSSIAPSCGTDTDEVLHDWLKN